MGKNLDYLKRQLEPLSLAEVANVLSEKHARELTLSKLIEHRDTDLVSDLIERINKTPEPLKAQTKDFLKGLGDGSREYEGLKTGIKEIDDLIGGLSKFVLCAGMAGVGKSSLAIQLALGVAKNEKIPVVYYSFEMEAREVITMAIQNITGNLQRKDIILRGKKPEQAELINKAIEGLKEITDRFYIVDSSSGKTPDIIDLKAQILNLKERHKANNIFVVIDSVQDIVPIEANQTQAEAKIAQQLVELQQQTGATLYAIAQKNKTGIREGGGYASVMGSVAFIHKPTTVLELIGGQEAISRAKADGNLSDDQIDELKKQLVEKTKNPNTPYPVFMNVIKGRNSGYGGVSLKYYGAYRRYEVGQDTEWNDINKIIDEVF